MTNSNNVNGKLTTSNIQNFDKTKIARIATNHRLKMAQTKTLKMLLRKLNFHFKLSNKSRAKLIELIKIERNRLIWGAYASK